MKKVILGVLCAVLVFSLGGCFGSGPQFENIDTAQRVDIDNVPAAEYYNDLDGLVSYFKALHYLPQNTAPTQMMAEVIGAKRGYRYVFTVNGSQTVVELYEYDVTALDDNAKRVTEEVKKSGAFHLFNKEGVDMDTTYTAYLSDSGKFMMLYTDNSSNTDNVVQAKSAQQALKYFYAKGTSETSKPEESSAASQPETSKNKESGKTSQVEGSQSTEDSTVV